MRRVAAAIVLTFSIAGCYSPNARKLEADVREKVQVGMPLAQAARTLDAMGIPCESTHPTAEGHLSCARVRQRLWASSCVERVTLAVSPADNIVRSVEIPPIRCAGL